MTRRMTNRAAIPLGCEVILPDPAANVRDVISRWSDSSVGRPAMVVVPGSEEDIIDAISYAKNERLRLIPAGGGHGSFVPIDSRTMYLDMKKFNGVALDEKTQRVTFGGGALTGQVVEACTGAGYYTAWPNNNAVGMTGFVLGGGNVGLLPNDIGLFGVEADVAQHLSAGLHGMAIDSVVSFRLITAEGEVLELNPASTGEELELFHALCGAGHGLGVVTSMTLKTFPLAELRMANNEVWARRLIFPGAAIDVAAEMYARLQPPPLALSLVMVFARSPPNSSVPGAPTIVLTASYFGPANEGEEATKLLFDDEVVRKAIKAETVMTPFAEMNDALEVFNVHGDFKDLSSAWLRTSTAAVIKSAFKRWLDFTGTYGDAKRTAAILGTNSAERQIAISKTAEGAAKHFESRDRGTCLLTLTWYAKPETHEPAAAFVRDLKAIYRGSQPGPDPPRTFANNMRPDTELEEMHSRERIKQLKRIKKLWDSSGVFWSPYGEKM